MWKLLKNVAVDAHSAEFAGILFWRLTVAADARDAVFAGGCSVETVAADAHDAGRGGVSAWFSQCGVCRDTRVGTAAADARDAVFAGVVVWKTVAADAHDAARGGVCGNCCVETIAAHAHDAVFAARRPLQMMLMMLLVSAWKSSRHILILQS